MKPNEITAKSTEFVRSVLTEQESTDYLYHNLDHTLSVVRYCEQFASDLNVSESDLFLLRLAALFHDTGYTRIYVGHEKASVEIARSFLADYPLTEDQRQQIDQLILATVPAHPPANQLEQIIKDADLSNLGSKNFEESGDNLRHEWKHILQEEFTDEAWLNDTLTFLEQHQYFTEPAKAAFGSRKKKNLKKIKKRLEKMTKKKDSKKVQGPIASSRTAQMMFKTALRNHIDLTSIADSKANMMLSINAIVISITMPLLASNIENNMFLLLPASLLLLTSVLSIIYATLATRPIKMNGLTPLDKVKEGKSNLFFFGNFYKMSNPDYRKGINEIIASEPLLEHTVVNDLYYLGKALGEKYNQLRICYLIFMTGITLTVLAFAVSFFFKLGS